MCVYVTGSLLYPVGGATVIIMTRFSLMILLSNSFVLLGHELYYIMLLLVSYCIFPVCTIISDSVTWNGAPPYARPSLLATVCWAGS